MNNKIIAVLIGILGLFLAISFASFLAEGNILIIAFGLAVFFGVIYLVFLNSYWLYLAFFYACLSFNVQPVGPSLAPLHIALLMAGIFVVANFWRKRQPLPGENEVRYHFRFFDWAFYIYTVYLVVHAYVSKVYPATYEAVSWANLAKQHVGMWGAYALIWIALHYVRFSRMPKNTLLWLILMVIIGLLVNIVIRGYGIFVLGIGTRDLGTGEQVGHGALFIPVLNLTENIHALRSLGPLAVLFAVAILTSTSSICKTPWIRFFGFLTAIMGLVGAIFSLGRAALAMAVIYSSIVLLWRKRIITLAAFVSVTILSLIAFRVIYEVEPDAVPFGIQRSLAMIPGMDMPEAKATIDASTNWRYELALRAYKEWGQTARNTLIGRGVYAYTDADVFAAELGGYWAKIDVALRRGATHNLFSDLLLVTGIVGFVLYYFVFFSIVYGTVKILPAARRFSSVSMDYFMVFIVTSIIYIPWGFIASGFFSLFNAVIVSVLILSASRGKAVKSETSNQEPGYAGGNEKYTIKDLY